MQKEGPKDYRSDLLTAIGCLAPQKSIIQFMEVCGTHTMTIGKSGLRELLPGSIRLLSGPGCPVCVTHEGEIEACLQLAREKEVLVATFGDLLRVPGPSGSLEEARGEGAEVRVVYSPLDALELAQNNPRQEVIFLGIGFETTAPAVAMAIFQAELQGIRNFSVYSMHKLIPPVLQRLLSDQEVNVDGFLLPGHVSTIIGTAPYSFLVQRYQKGGVITGFETEDILEALVMLLRQIQAGFARLELQYRRGVRVEGNPTAREILARVFEPEDAWWRGLGRITGSGLKIRASFGNYDAKAKFKIVTPVKIEREAVDKCICGSILKGLKLPLDCQLFGKECLPSNPQGPCMVSSEGTCAAYYRFKQR